jgi:hypothetical protein
VRVYAEKFEVALAVCLAHSAVFFSGEDWHPVRDAQNNGKDKSTAEQNTNQQQVGAQGGGQGSQTLVAGAQSVGAGNSGVLLHGTFRDNTVNVTSADPAVAEAAINQVGETAHDALSYEAQAAGDSESVAFASETLASQALAQANRQQADNASTIESLSAEFAAGLSQSANNAQILASEAQGGPAQDLSYGLQQSSGGDSTLTKWYYIFGIGAAVVAIWFYFKRGKQ